MASLLIAVLLLLAVPMSGNAQQQGYCWSIKPPGGVGPDAVIGPYVDQVIGGKLYTGQAMGRDMLGSAQNAHGWSCHLGWTAAGCAPLKNKNGVLVLGFGYPVDYPNPPNPKLVSDDVYQCPVTAPVPASPVWVLPFFHADGSVSVEKCSDLPKIIKLHKLNPKNRIGHYANLKCPGAPCITSNVSTACN